MATADRIDVYAGASKRDGAVAPSRIISGNIDGASFTIDVKRNVLYDVRVPGTPTTTIDVYDHIDTAKGEVVAARRILIAGPVHLVAVDSSRDRLYGHAGVGKISILDGASSAAGQVAVTALSVPVKTDGAAITIDAPNDRLYVGYGATAIVLNDASKRTNASSTAQAVAITATPTTVITFFAVPQ